MDVPRREDLFLVKSLIVKELKRQERLKPGIGNLMAENCVELLSLWQLAGAAEVCRLQTSETLPHVKEYS